MARHPAGKNVPIPQHVRDHLVDLAKKKGALADVCRKAGLHDTALYRVKHGQHSMNEHYLARIMKVLAGEPVELPPAKAVARRAHAPVVAEMNGHLGNGREAGLRAMLDGIALGVEITRRSVVEYLSKP